MGGRGEIPVHLDSRTVLRDEINGSSTTRWPGGCEKGSCLVFSLSLPASDRNSVVLQEAPGKGGVQVTFRM